MWEKLISTALLGADRSQLDLEVQQKLEQWLGFPLSEDPAETLLQGTAFLGVLRRTAREIPFLGKIESAEPFPEDNRMALSPSLARQLMDMLQGKYEAFLPQALSLIYHYQISLPPESLPLLWDLALEKPELQPITMANMHPSETRMARQHPNWRLLAPIPVAKPNASKSRDLYLAEYRALRKNGQALIDLEDRWADFSAQDKVFFLSAFAPPYSNWDSTFLENALCDKRKAVRHQVAVNLIKDIHSPLFRDWTSWLSEWISIKKGQVTFLPEKIPVEPWNKLGLWKAKPLEQLELIGRLTPPEAWPKLLNMELGEWLSRISSVRFGKAWLKGYMDATIELRSSASASALLLATKGNDLGLSERSIKQLIQVLSAQDFLSLISKEMKKNTGLVPEGSLASELLMHSQHSWPAGLTRSVIGAFQEWMLTASTVNWNVWHYRKILRKAAYQMEPKAIALWEQGWPDYGYIWSQWQTEVDHFRKILRFRSQFYKDLMQSIDG